LLSSGRLQRIGHGVLVDLFEVIVGAVPLVIVAKIRGRFITLVVGQLCVFRRPHSEGWGFVWIWRVTGMVVI
jgi:hypothetical protein